MQSEGSDILTELERWYAGDSGHYLLEQTRDATRDMVDTAFGYHILQLGVRGHRPLCAGSPINHQVYCAERPAAGVGLIAHPDELPLEGDSVDAVILHHCLEFARRPHQVLREIQRVLRPHGQFLVIGFNPYSLLGVGAQARGLLGNPLWRNHRPLGENRLTDWLRLLGCEVQEVIRLYAVPTAGRGRLRRALEGCDTWSRRLNLPLGGLLIVHATKQVPGLIRPRRTQRLRSGRLVGLVPKPTPAPTPILPAPCGSSRFEKGDVAA